MTSFRLQVSPERVLQLLCGLNGSRTFVITRQAGTGHVYTELIDVSKLPLERWDFPGTPAAIGRFSLLRDLKRPRAGNVNCWPRR